MSQADHGKGGSHPEPNPKYFYFVDGKKYEWDVSSITGAQIRSQIANLDPSYQLFLESHGDDPDQPILDNTSIVLDRAGQGVPRLYTVAPATFGRP